MSIYDIVGWPTISQDIRDHTRYRIRYVILGCLVRRHLSLHEGLDVQYCPCKHTSQQIVFCYFVHHIPKFQNMHPYRITSATDIPALVGTTYPALPGPPAVPETYLFSKELVAYLETPIASSFSCNYRADDSCMAGKIDDSIHNIVGWYKISLVDIRYRRLIYDIVGWYTIS